MSVCTKPPLPPPSPEQVARILQSLAGALEHLAARVADLEKQHEPAKAQNAGG